MRCLSRVALVASALPLLASITSASNSSTFLYAATANHDVYNITFTLSVVQETNDIFFRLSVPDAAYSWVAVGTGPSMNGALIFLAFANDNGQDIVLSPRISTAHVEPSYNSDILLSQVDPPAADPYPNGIHDGTWFVSGQCKNCTNVGHGVSALDLTAENQPFIFAFGDWEQQPGSNALDAPLRQHIAFGAFAMNMTRATITSGHASQATVPALGTAMDGARLLGGVYFDSNSDNTSSMHAMLMCGAFVIIFPMGLIILKMNVRAHAVVQAIGLFFVIGGLGVGLQVGKYYNRSKHVSSGHQIFGLIILALLILQFSAGLVHHIHHAKTQQRLGNGRVITAHRYLGPLVMAAGILNGAIGFRFALTRWNYTYVPFVLAVLFVAFIAALLKPHVRRWRGASGGGGGGGRGGEALAPPQASGQPPSYPQNAQGAAPPYAPPPSRAPVRGPYNDGGWGARSENDIDLASMEPQRPKQML